MDDAEVRQALQRLAARIERIERRLETEDERDASALEVLAGPRIEVPGPESRPFAAPPERPPVPAVELPPMPDAPPDATRIPQAVEKTPSFERGSLPERPAQPAWRVPPLPVESAGPTPVAPYDAVGRSTPAPPPVASRESRLAAFRRLLGESFGAEPTRQPRAAEMPAVPADTAAAFGDDTSAQTLEMRIGTRWMAWAGAAVVMLAVVFFVKLAYDAGWWGRLPNAVKCALTASFGGLLLAAGELALRKVGRPAAVSLFGGGLGTLYLTAYATYRYFSLASDSVAFVLMAAVALLGFAVTLRGRMLAIGVLSAIGGYMTPLWLQPESAFAASFPSYLTMLLAVALALSARLPKPFRALRYVAMAAHGLIGLTWALSEGTQHWLMSLTFLSLWWAMVGAEAVYAARRVQSDIGNVVALILSTAWYATVGCRMLDRVQGDGNWLGVFTVCIAAAAGVAAWLIGGGTRSLRGVPQTAIDKLAVTLWGQAGVLTALAIGLQFNQPGRNDYGQTIGWLAMGLACVEIGRRLRSRGVDVFGLMVGALALLRVAMIDADNAVLNGPLWEVPAAVHLTPWTILALVAVAAMHVAAWRVRDAAQGAWLRMPAVLTALSVAGWMAVCYRQCDGLTITAAWLAASVALIAVEPLAKRQRYLELSLCALVATAGRWLIVDAALRRVSPAWSPHDAWPLLNGQMALAACIAAAGAWAALKLRRQAAAARVADDIADAVPEPLIWQLFLLGASAMLLIGVSFELDALVADLASRPTGLRTPASHLRQLLFTLLWTVGAVGVGGLAVVFGPRRADGTMRDVGLLQTAAWGLLALVGVKWIVLDTLFWAVPIGRSTGGMLPLLNLQMLAGLLLTGGLVALAWMTGIATLAARSARGESDVESSVDPRLLQLAGQLPVAVGVLLLWALSFELERAVGLYESSFDPDRAPLWSGPQFRMLWLTLLWAAGGAAMLLYNRLRGWPALRDAGWFVLATAAIVWLTADTLAARMQARPVLVWPVANLQFAVGAALIGLLFAALRITRSISGSLRQSSDADNSSGPGVPFDARARVERQTRALAALLIGAIGLWLGTLEIDRFCAPHAGRFADSAMVRQTGLSIFWGLYGISLVALGFVRRWAVSRYVGLALLALTLGKVMLIDLAAVRYIYRVLSLLGVGLLLVGTSIAYTKLAARLLSERPGCHAEAQRRHGVAEPLER